MLLNSDMPNCGEDVEAPPQPLAVAGRGTKWMPTPKEDTCPFSVL
ncbi:MAG: hypothetical protein OXB95_02400 [Rhodobacteraceae bacterium]|nr:hypothetical protein [Paracoccaceae bacterium]